MSEVEDNSNRADQHPDGRPPATGDAPLRPNESPEQPEPAEQSKAERQGWLGRDQIEFNSAHPNPAWPHSPASPALAELRSRPAKVGRWMERVLLWFILFFFAINIVYMLADSHQNDNSFVFIIKILWGLSLLITFPINATVFSTWPLGAHSNIPAQLKRLNTSYEIVLAGCALFLGEIAWLIVFLTVPAARAGLPLAVNIWNLVVAFLLLYLLRLIGLIRAIVSSKQLSLPLRSLLIAACWIPLVNEVLGFIVAPQLGRELRTARHKLALNQARQEARICATRYPIVLVHGIFFRDSDLLNYWGRIPAELEANGAHIFYGQHSSSLPVAESAAELRERILSICQQTGAEKVNVIAHSKGGMDMRYAISCLGLASRVASLTTINTPHHGSDLAVSLLKVAPAGLVQRIAGGYSAIFTKLGDSTVDFTSSVRELTSRRAAELNALMADSPEVYYQSVGSAMRQASSAPFPLSLGYTIIKPTGGDNDGLVATSSMRWGHFLGVQTGSGKRGISHGDMIDLSRHDIPGFDVTEFYVQLVAGLKERGF